MNTGRILPFFGIESGAKTEIISEGLINESVKVLSCEGDFLLQRVNTGVFENPVGMMGNIEKVVSVLPGISLKRTIDGKSFHEDESGFYRMYTFVENSVCHSHVTDEGMLRAMGEALGEFHRTLSSLDPKDFVETIPRFHDIRHRLEELNEAVEGDVAKRVSSTRAELDFIEGKVGIFLDFYKLYESGILPKRVVHNDAKLSNILFEREGGGYLTFVDFDTVMPGTVIFDIGDMIRTGASSVDEDYPEVEEVRFIPGYFDRIVSGYTSRNRLSESEYSAIGTGCKYMAYIMAVRFLSDYLRGDTYYRTVRKNQNLDRARNQIALIKSMSRYI